MKFSILSHAGLLVESAGIRLAIDPWILGSCYWRSWWNYPPAPEWARHLESLDYVYLTHLHWDHFHGPSLRKLPKAAKLLVPEAHFTRMVKDGGIFFDEIIELPHGKPFQLADDLTITSYQFGLMMDSVLAIEDGCTTLLDLNDCKIRGLPLDQILKRHPSVDFVFRSHSSASAYPWCVETDDDSALSYRTNEDYLRDFSDTAAILGAKYAIPFASAHCFLHRETFEYNDTAVSPDDVKIWFDAHKPEGSECVVMVAGDSWSDDGGFQIHPHDWYTNKQVRLAECARDQQPALDKQYALEERSDLDFGAFERYFRAQVDALPAFTRFLFKPKVVFELKERPEVHWVVDYDRRTVEAVKERPTDYALRLTIPTLVLKDCIHKRLFSTFTASKRLRIELRRGHWPDFPVFFQLLDMYEYEYFPLRRLLTRRFVRVWARRWRELWFYVRLLASLALRRGDDPISRLMPQISPETRRS